MRKLQTECFRLESTGEVALRAAGSKGLVNIQQFYVGVSWILSRLHVSPQKVTALGNSYCSTQKSQKSINSSWQYSTDEESNHF